MGNKGPGWSDVAEPGRLIFARGAFGGGGLAIVTSRIPDGGNLEQAEETCRPLLCVWP